MGQQVNRSSKVKSPSESDWTINYFFYFITKYNNNYNNIHSDG